MAKEEAELKETTSEYSPYSDLLIVGNLPEEEELGERFESPENRVTAYKRLLENGYDLSNVGLVVDVVGKKHIERVVERDKGEAEAFFEELRLLRSSTDEKKAEMINSYKEILKPKPIEKNEDESEKNEGGESDLTVKIIDVAVEKGNENEERLQYLATKLVTDLENLYGSYESKDEVDQEGFALAAARLRKNGIVPLYKQEDGRGLVVDVANGEDLTTLIADYLSMDSGTPNDWDAGLEFVKKSGIDIGMLAEARQRKGEFLNKSEKEKPVKDERYIWYPGMDTDLARATKLPPEIKKDATEKDRKRVERDLLVYTEQKEESLKNLRKRIPDFDQKAKADNGRLYWAVRVLTGGAIFDKEGEQINPWPTKESALAYLRDTFGIDRSGVDRESDPKNQATQEVVEVVDLRKRSEDLLLKLSQLSGDEVGRERIITELEAAGVKIRGLLAGIEKITPGMRSEVMIQLRAVVEIWRMDEVKRREYPVMTKVAASYARVLGL